MSYLDEFPDFDDTPLMLNWPGRSTWGDASWHNDTCPSFTSDDLMPGYIVRVWSDYEDENMRESYFNNSPKFGVVLYSEHDEYICDLLRADDMMEVESLIKTLERANPNPDACTPGDQANTNQTG